MKCFNWSWIFWIWDIKAVIFLLEVVYFFKYKIIELERLMKVQHNTCFFCAFRRYSIISQQVLIFDKYNKGTIICKWGQTYCILVWASHRNWEVEMQSLWRSFAVDWKLKGSPFVVLPLYSQEDPDCKTTTFVFLL